MHQVCSVCVSVAVFRSGLQHFSFLFLDLGSADSVPVFLRFWLQCLRFCFSVCDSAPASTSTYQSLRFLWLAVFWIRLHRSASVLPLGDPDEVKYFLGFHCCLYSTIALQGHGDPWVIMFLWD